MARVLQPGDEVSYTVTFLEMLERPRKPIPARPANQNVALLAADNPPVEYFLYLYKSVGEAYEWTDWLQRPLNEAQDFVGNPDISLYTLMLDGWPGGFFMLDASEQGICDLAYFGLVPQAVGRGLGNWSDRVSQHSSNKGFLGARAAQRPRARPTRLGTTPSSPRGHAPRG